MRTFISEGFIFLVIIAVIFMGAIFAKDSVAATVQEIGTALEERKLNKQLISKLKGVSGESLHGIAIEILLWDVRALRSWLETKTMLPDAKKEQQVEECRRTASERHSHYSEMLRDMSDKQVTALIRKEFGNRDMEWRRRFIEHLDDLKAVG